MIVLCRRQNSVIARSDPQFMLGRFPETSQWIRLNRGATLCSDLFLVPRKPHLAPQMEWLSCSNQRGGLRWLLGKVGASRGCAEDLSKLRLTIPLSRFHHISLSPFSFCCWMIHNQVIDSPLASSFIAIFYHF